MSTNDDDGDGRDGDAQAREVILRSGVRESNLLVLRCVEKFRLFV